MFLRPGNLVTVLIGQSLMTSTHSFTDLTNHVPHMSSVNIFQETKFNTRVYNNLYPRSMEFFLRGEGGEYCNAMQTAVYALLQPLGPIVKYNYLNAECWMLFIISILVRLVCPFLLLYL